jgi:hypothetical protein
VAPKSGDFGATTAAATGHTGVERGGTACEREGAAECKRFARTLVVGKPDGVPADHIMLTT